MKKRFKPGAQVVLTEGDTLRAVTALMSEVVSEHGACRLTAEDIRRIQAADLLEDVPEPKTPGQRLEDALREAGLGVHLLRTGRLALGDESVDRVARALGIKPEGE